MNFRKKKRVPGAILLVLAMLTSMFAPLTAHAAVVDDSWTMYMVANAHIDTAWQWPYEDTARDIIPVSYSRAVNALKANPNNKFTASATKHYEWAKEYYPELYAEIKELVAAGQWGIAGGQVVQPDLNLPSGESLVRQNLLGQHFFDREFGIISTVGYVPDTFGFSGQFPQILKKSGMDYFVTTKLNWQDTNRDRDSDIFKWQGIDGDSQVLSYACMQDYVANYNDDQIQQALLRNEQSGKETGIKRGMGMFGSGDHGNGPNENEYASYLSRSGGSGVNGATIELATIQDYFDTVSQDDLSRVRTVDGEMYFENHRGTYTSWVQIKKYNRDNEVLAEKAEKAAAIGNWLGVSAGTDSANMEKAWDKILINQFHDVIPGSSIPYTYQDAFNNHTLAENMMSETLYDGMQAMAYKADTNVAGEPLLVFNALGWERSGMVQADVYFSDGLPSEIAVYDGDTMLPTTEISRSSDEMSATLRFYAEAIPAIGYKVFSVQAAGTDTPSSDLSIAEDDDLITLENTNLKVEINKSTGNISQIYNKQDGNRQVFANGFEGNEIHILKDTGGTAYPAWDLVKSQMNAAPVAILNSAPDSITVLEDTVERIVVRVKRSWSQSAMYQDITLDKESDQLDVRMVVDWREDQHMLKVSFPFAVEADQAAYEVAYGSLERPTTRDNRIDEAKFEVSGHKWADVTANDKSNGISVLNDSKYGWDALKIKSGNDFAATRLRLTALRSPIGATVRCAGWDPAAYFIDKTLHDFTYSIYPHSGSWEEAGTVLKGYELNYKPDAVQASKHEGILASELSFASSSADNVQLTVIKTPYDNTDSKDELIIRVYESSGKSGSPVTITLPAEIESVKEVNLLEHEDANLNKSIDVSGNTFSFSVDKYEIATFAVKLAQTNEAAAELEYKTVDLDAYFNVDGVSFDSDRADGDYDGMGNTIPGELWPEKITVQGIPFNFGSAQNGENNIMQANGQRIQLPEGKFDYVYILGAAAGKGNSSGEFTIFQDGTSVSKELSFANWQANLSGWNRFTNAYLDPKVEDQIATFFTHFHNGSVDRMTVDNYQYLYAIKVDPNADLESILLPDASGIKIIAITAVQSDYLAQLVKIEKETVILDAPTDVTAEYNNDIESEIKLTWTLSPGAVSSYIYRFDSRSKSYDLSDGTFLGTAIEGNTFVDVKPSGGENFYRIVCMDANGNASAPSEISNEIFVLVQNIFLTLPQNRFTAPSSFSNEEPYRACDGNPSTKWCGRADDIYLQVDLGEGNTWAISKFSLLLAGAENTNYIARDYRIDISDTGSNWTTVADVKNNTNNTPEHLLQTPIQTRYIRLVPTYAAQISNDWNCPRIYEFEAWGVNTTTAPVVYDVEIAAKNNPENSDNVILEAHYSFNKNLAENSIDDVQHEWFGITADNESVRLDNTGGKTMEIAKDILLSYQKMSVKVTPFSHTGTAGTMEEKIIVLNSGPDNISLSGGRYAVASSQVNAGESGQHAIDGSYTSKWCTLGVHPGNPAELIIDFESIFDISQIDIFHATYAYDNSMPGAHVSDKHNVMNTREYNLFVSTDGKNWTQIANHPNPDGENHTTDAFEGNAVGRYLKLQVTKPVGDPVPEGQTTSGDRPVRINEIQLLGRIIDFVSDESTEPETPEAKVTQVKIIPAQAAVEAGSDKQFKAVVEGLYNPTQDVIWTVEGGSEDTSISDTGLLSVSADESTTELTVKAVSVVDDEKFATVIVTVTGSVDPLPNKQALEAMIAQAELLAEEDYTPDSWAVFAQALANAKDVLADDDAIQTEINTAKDALQDAMDNLKRDGEEIPVTKIKINASGLFTLSVKKTAQIPVSIEPNDATDPSVKWISTNPNIFTVDEDGNITPHKQGTATLTAQSSNGLKSTIIVRITA